MSGCVRRGPVPLRMRDLLPHLRALEEDDYNEDESAECATEPEKPTAIETNEAKTTFEPKPSIDCSFERPRSESFHKQQQYDKFSTPHSSNISCNSILREFRCKDVASTPAEPKPMPKRYETPLGNSTLNTNRTPFVPVQHSQNLPIRSAKKELYPDLYDVRNKENSSLETNSSFKVNNSARDNSNSSNSDSSSMLKTQIPVKSSLCKNEHSISKNLPNISEVEVYRNPDSLLDARKESERLEEIVKAPEAKSFHSEATTRPENSHYESKDAVKGPELNYVDQQLNFYKKLQSGSSTKHEESQESRPTNEFVKREGNYVNQQLNNSKNLHPETLAKPENLHYESKDAVKAPELNYVDQQLNFYKKLQLGSSTKPEESQEMRPANEFVKPEGNYANCSRNDESAHKPTNSIFAPKPPIYPAKSAEKIIEPMSELIQDIKTAPPLLTKQFTQMSIKGKRYIVLGKLGSGGSSDVYKVMDPENSSIFAVKCVNMAVDPSVAKSYVNEIKLLQRLQGSDRVITMFDYEYVKHQKKLYVLLEIGDVDLSSLLKYYKSQNKSLPYPILVGYWTEMLTAVNHIHKNGIIHSDLKPANFLLVHGRLKLIDFGIASSLNADATSIIRDSTTGTFNYISPEAITMNEANAKAKISYKSDVWSLGCILYSMLYGHTPFNHVKHLYAKIAALSNPNQNINYPLLNGVPPVLLKALKWCLTFDVKRRPTVQELIDLPYLNGGNQTLANDDIPLSIIVKIKAALTDDEWQKVVKVIAANK